MTKPKLTYFDAPVSRGEECRLALHVAGIDFEDHRIKSAEWPEMKPKTPFGSLPTLEMPGRPVLGQSNAILVMIGRAHGLHPDNDFELGAAEYENIKDWVFKALASGTLSQGFDDTNNRVQLQAAEK